MGGSKREEKAKGKRGRKKKVKEEEEEIYEDNFDFDEEEGVPGAAKKNAENAGGATVLEDEFGAKDYRKVLEMKPDHVNRPLWVAPNGHIFLESFSPVYKHAHDFLIAISEPVCRPEHIHEYKLTAYSLYAAVSVGLETDDIIEYLRRLSKTSIPDGIVEFIKLCTLSYGKVKLVLKHNKYFIESPFPEVLQKLLKDPVIQECRLRRDADMITQVETKKAAPQFGAGKPGTESAAAPAAEPVQEVVPVPDDITDFYSKLDKADEDDDEQQTSTVSFEVDQCGFETFSRTSPLSGEKLEENVRKRKSQIGRHRASMRRRQYDLSFHIRSQRQADGMRSSYHDLLHDNALAKTLLGGRADHEMAANAGMGHHGIGRLVNARQLYYRDLFSNFTLKLISPSVFSFYRPEVHTIPAKMFRRVLTIVQSHCKLGLTATLLREDDKIADLNFLIGPKLYEANWLELQSKNYIAKVQCAEVWCPMTADFYREYLHCKTCRKLIEEALKPAATLSLPHISPTSTYLNGKGKKHGISQKAHWKNKKKGLDADILNLSLLLKMGTSTLSLGRFTITDFQPTAEVAEEKPQKEEYSVADWLKKNVPVKKTKFLNHNVQYFTGSKAVDALMESKWAKPEKEGEEPLFPTREHCVTFLDEMLRHKFFHRAKKVAISEELLKSKKKRDVSKSSDEKEKKTDKEKTEKKEEEVGESSHAEGKAPEVTFWF
ncbi:unnamed protein product [Nesidiocoris tenuis]|uniref:Uncharacterized protein n=1 Tax=Nesidiocoris tenuis TaxID=355587 RepID=A0A6H5HJ44_9HEMI|nr:unnamed protein product [Nesidiocoris tenuis]